MRNKGLFLCEARIAGRLPQFANQSPANRPCKRKNSLARLVHYVTARHYSHPTFAMFLDRLEENLRTYRTALGVRSHRQELLASNIANADTPHFKARDVDFKSALATALGTSGADMSGPLDMARTQRGHLAGDGTNPYGAAVKYRAEYQGAVDGNTVNMDVERASFAENALQVEALITFINKRFEGLQRAISGQ